MPGTSQDQSNGGNKAVGDAKPVVEGTAQTLTEEASSKDSTQGHSTHAGPGTTGTKMDALFKEGRVKGAAADKVFATTCWGVDDEAPPPLRARHSLRGRLSLDLDGHRPLSPHACRISAADGAVSRRCRMPRRNSAAAKRRGRRLLRERGLRGRRRRLSPRNCSGRTRAFDMALGSALGPSAIGIELDHCYMQRSDTALCGSGERQERLETKMPPPSWSAQCPGRMLTRFCRQNKRASQTKRS